MSFNKLIVVGNLGRDVELRYTPQGTAVADFSVATTEGKKNKNGEWDNITTWFKCTAWGKTAENCNKNLEKGSQVYLEGRLSEEKWTDKDGNERTSLCVNVDSVQFLTKKASSDSEETFSGEETTKVETKGKAKGKAASDEDIPF